jgi:hypothetical protein
MRLLFALALAGCSFPEYDFARRDSQVAAGDTAVSDSSAPTLDSSVVVADTNVVAMDTTVTMDTTMTMDTTVVDTFKPDTTPPPDTFKPDVVADVPVSTGCVGITAAFCSDWDKATEPKTDFSWDGVSPTGSLTLDVGGGRSSPNAMLSTTSPSTTADVVVANVSRTFTAPSATASARIDVWLKLESATFPTAGGGAAFLFKFQTNMGGGDGVTFSMNNTGFFIDRIGVTYEDYPIAVTPKVSAWTHVRLDARLHTTNGSFTCWIDDMTTPVLTRTGISTLKVDTTMQQLIIGLYSQKANGTFKVRYDDVTLDWK